MIEKQKEGNRCKFPKLINENDVWWISYWTSINSNNAGEGFVFPLEGDWTIHFVIPIADPCDIHAIAAGC